MLSTKSLGVADSGIASYYEHLAADDYYQQGAEPPGQWRGRLAGALGLEGNVRAGQLRKLFEGYDPATGRALAGNAGEKHKAGWDLTFSAPKSVSVAWAFADEGIQQAIAEAHDRAVAAGLDYLERNAFASRDRSGVEPLKGIIAATYQHSTSRELDPQLHSHCAVANIGLREDGTACAVDFDSRWKMAGGAVYRAELAHQLQLLGFAIERDGHSFRLPAIPQNLCETFSKRRRQIVEYARQTGFDSAKSRDIAALATRKAKESQGRGILREKWLREAIDAGYSPEELKSMLPSVSARHRNIRDGADLKPAGIFVALTQAEATFTRQQLEAAIATEAQGLAGSAELPLLVEQVIKKGLSAQGPEGLVCLEVAEQHPNARRRTLLYTTREMLGLEREALESAISRQSERQHMVALPSGLLDGLSAEQAEAVRHVIEKSGGVACVRGLAGTGKSFMLDRARQAWEAAGLTVVGAALAGKAADGLQQGSGIPSQTLHSLLSDIQHRRYCLDKKTVVVLDEAGMVGSRQLHMLLSKVQQAGAKLVMVGDPQQLQPIEAGGLFRRISDDVGYAGLTEIRRQEAVEDRQMIKQLIGGQAMDVIDQLSANGQLTVAHDDHVADVMVQDWLASRDQQRPGESLMLAGTKADVRKLNAIAREMLKAQHQLHSEITLETEHGEREFAIGDRIICTRNSHALGVKNGQLGTLESWRIDAQSGAIVLAVRLDSGAVVTFDPAAYGHIEHGYAISVHKAQGVTVDQVSVLISESMADREWSYVALSRHRQRLRVFVPESTGQDLETNIRRSRQKALASEYADLNAGMKNCRNDAKRRQKNQQDCELG